MTASTTLEFTFDWHDEHCSIDVDALLDDLPTAIAADLRASYAPEELDAFSTSDWEDIACQLERDAADHDPDHPDTVATADELEQASDLIGRRLHLVSCDCTQRAWSDFTANVESGLNDLETTSSRWAVYDRDGKYPELVTRAITWDKLRDLGPDEVSRFRLTLDPVTGIGEIRFDSYTPLPLYLVTRASRVHVMETWAGAEMGGGLDDEYRVVEAMAVPDHHVDVIAACQRNDLWLVLPDGGHQDALLDEDHMVSWLSYERCLDALNAAGLAQITEVSAPVVTELAGQWHDTVQALFAVALASHGLTFDPALVPAPLQVADPDAA